MSSAAPAWVSVVVIAVAVLGSWWARGAVGGRIAAAVGSGPLTVLLRVAPHDEAYESAQQEDAQSGGYESRRLTLARALRLVTPASQQVVRAHTIFRSDAKDMRDYFVRLGPAEVDALTVVHVAPWRTSLNVWLQCAADEDALARRTVVFVQHGRRDGQRLTLLGSGIYRVLLPVRGNDAALPAGLASEGSGLLLAELAGEEHDSSLVELQWDAHRGGWAVQHCGPAVLGTADALVPATLQRLQDRLLRAPGTMSMAPARLKAAAPVHTP